MTTLSYASLAKFSPGTYIPMLDTTGTLLSNYVTDEKHVISAANGKDFHFIVPLFAPFYSETNNFIVIHTSATGVNTVLKQGIDYLPAFQFIGASRACAKPIFGAISFINTKLAGTITLSYQTLGGNWTLDIAQITSMLAGVLINPRTLAWEQVVDRPALFPVIDHEWNLTDMVGASEITAEIRGVADAITAASLVSTVSIETSHALDQSNPHNVTKAQIGLGQVNNFPIATPEQARSGTSNAAYMTPSLTKSAIDQHLSNGAAGGLRKAKNYFNSQI